MVNKIGPRTEPCGTPKGKLCQDKVLALIFYIFLVKIQKSTFLNEVF